MCLLVVLHVTPRIALALPSVHVSRPHHAHFLQHELRRKHRLLVVPPASKQAALQLLSVLLLHTVAQVTQKLHRHLRAFPPAPLPTRVPPPYWRAAFLNPARMASTSFL